MTVIWFAIGFYFAVLNLAAMIATIVDKRRAVRHAWRIPEATLLGLGLLGGAFLEWITMKRIRHKTKHRKFMVTLPIFFLLHLGILIAVYFLWLR